MHLSRSLQILLLALMAAALAAIVGSFVSRRQQAAPSQKTEILAPEISRRTTEFEYSEHKQGRTVFLVNAATSTETVKGVHSLEQVLLSYFTEQGTASDTVSGRQAEYHIEEKSIRFAGQVRIVLATGAEVVCDRVDADLEREIVSIRERFRFRKENLSGEAEALVYRIPRRLMEMSGSVKMTLAGIDAVSERAEYALKEQRIGLEGGARVRSEDTELEAARIAIALDRDTRLRELRGAGGALLKSGEGRAFQGDEIRAVFESGRLAFFYLSAQPPSRTVYRQGSGDQGSRLQARTMKVWPLTGQEFAGAGVSRLEASGDVELSSPASGIEKGEAGRVTAEFSSRSGALKSIRLEQGARLRQRSKNGPGETVRAREIAVRLAAGGGIESLRAREEVVLETASGGAELRALQSDELDVEYQNGAPRQLSARGDCVVENREPELAQRLEAPRVEVSYQAGTPRRAVAAGGVNLRLQDNKQIQRSSSREMELQFEEGRLSAASQTGHVHFQRHNAELFSEAAHYDARRRATVATGREQPRLKMSNADGHAAVTFADRFVLAREIVALGSVRTEVEQAAGAVVIKAGQMEWASDSNWIRYTLSPTVVQKSDATRAREVRFDLQAQALIAEGQVESTFARPRSGAFLIRAGHMAFSRGGSRVVYRENVTASTQELEVEAPVVEFLVDSAGDLERMVATGGVFLVQGGRRARGSEAVYHPADQKIVLLGNPAQVTEGGEYNKAEGRQLTFFIGTDRLLVESGPATSRP